MKKVALAIMVMAVLAITVGAYAQVVTPVPKQATLEELQWKAAYLQERIKTLQIEFKNVQDTLKLVQDEIKARQSAQPPKEKEIVKPEPAKEEKKGKK